MPMTDTDLTPIDAPQHALAIVNPASGSKRGNEVIERLREVRSPRVTLHVTTPEFDFAAAIRAGVDDGADRILVAGGDGTLMDGVSGAYRALGREILPFSWVPAGTGNVVSGFLGLPHRVDLALKLALGPGLIRRIDLAKVGDRCSVLRVSTGFEAEVAYNVTHSGVWHLWPALAAPDARDRISDLARRAAADQRRGDYGVHHGDWRADVD